MRQRPFGIDRDLHGSPLRVRAPHRRPVNIPHRPCMGLFLNFFRHPPLLLDVTDDGLSTLMDVNMFYAVTFCSPPVRYRLSASS